MERIQTARTTALIEGHYDRPSNWISNILCFYHSKCRSPLTGGYGGEAKSMPYTKPATQEAPKPQFTLHPNPASAWVAVTYDLQQKAEKTFIQVKDALGRSLESHQLTNEKGQLVIDTRRFEAGMYTLELINSDRIVHLERLIVQ